MRCILTDAQIKGIRKPKKGRTELSDIRCLGLTFRITDKGAKTFSYRFRDPATGRVGRVTLGRYPDLSLVKARAKADTLRASVAEGVNPAEHKRRQRASAATRTFGAIADRYVEEYAKRHKKASSVREDERNLRLHLKPEWEHRSIDDIGRADVIELTEALAKSGREVLANRVQALVSGIFTFALDAGLTKSNPCWRLRRRAAEKAATRVLTDDEIRFFWPAVVLPPLTRRTGFALRLMLLTGVRPGEAAGLHRAEIQKSGRCRKGHLGDPGGANQKRDHSCCATGAPSAGNDPGRPRFDRQGRGVRFRLAEAAGAADASALSHGGDEALGTRGERTCRQELEIRTADAP